MNEGPTPLTPAGSGEFAAWDDGEPPVRIGRLGFVRLLALPGPSEKPQDAPHRWVLRAERGPTDHALTIVGEITRIVDGFFFSVAAEACLGVHPDHLSAMNDDDDLDEALERYGPWASHALWDFCRPALLQLMSGFPLQAPLDIPISTPEPLLLTKRLQREADQRHPSGVEDDDAEDSGT